MIERTHDEAWVTGIVTHPRVWPWISEDGQDPATWRMHPGAVALRYGDHGLFLLNPTTTVAWEAHTCMLPHTPDVDAAAREAMAWMFTNTAAQKITTSAFDTHRHAIALAKRAGFVEEGRLTAMVMWRGKPRDLFIYGVQKCPQQSQ